MTPINGSFAKGIDNSHRYIKLERAKNKFEIRRLGALYVDAKSHSFTELARGYQSERSHISYILSIIRIADDALDMLKNSIAENDLLLEKLNADDLTDVKSSPSPTSPRSPGTYGVATQ